MDNKNTTRDSVQVGPCVHMYDGSSEQYKEDYILCTRKGPSTVYNVDYHLYLERTIYTVQEDYHLYRERTIYTQYKRISVCKEKVPSTQYKRITICTEKIPSTQYKRITIFSIQGRLPFIHSKESSVCLIHVQNV